MRFRSHPKMSWNDAPDAEKDGVRSWLLGANVE
jgi:hypothetical protein